MTTYPLSEPATIHDGEEDGVANGGVIGRGTLADCADLVAGLAPERRKAVSIQMDSLDLRFGSEEVGELLRFLHQEEPGLSDREIADIKVSGT